MWVCTSCHEQHDDAFDACWSCGNERGGAPSIEPQRSQAAQGETAEVQAGYPRDAGYAPGTRTLLLAGERIIRSLRLVSLFGPEEAVAHLTDLRLMLTTQEHILLFIPAGTSERVALVEDVDSAGTTSKRLPTAVAIAGLLLLAGGAAMAQVRGADALVVLLAALGCFLLLLWLFVRRTLLVFSAGGMDCFEMAYVRAGSSDTAVEEFIQTLFRLKTRRGRRVRTG